MVKRVYHKPVNMTKALKIYLAICLLESLMMSKVFSLITSDFTLLSKHADYYNSILNKRTHTHTHPEFPSQRHLKSP